MQTARFRNAASNLTASAKLELQVPMIVTFGLREFMSDVTVTAQYYFRIWITEGLELQETVEVGSVLPRLLLAHQ